MEHQQLGFSQKQQQKLKLSQTMRQSIMMLQLDTPDLIHYLKAQSLENPFMEVRTAFDYLTPHSIGMPQYFDYANRCENNLYDYLLEQITFMTWSINIKKVVRYLITQLEPTGYLTISNEVMMNEQHISETDAQKARKLLQQLDPPGVGASTLQECLLIQASESNSKYAALAEKIIKDSFPQLLEHHTDELQELLKLTKNEVDSSLRLIRSFYATPGELFSKSQVNYVIPELVMKVKRDKISLTLTRYGKPELLFAAESFKQFQKHQEKDIQEYLRLKKDNFLSVKAALEQRQATLVLISKQLIHHQADYLRGYSEFPRPLLLNEVAHELHINESTVSRAIHGVYMETPVGVIPLKALFARYSNGKGNKSVEELMLTIKNLVAKESKTSPLTDEDLAGQLCEHGFDVARRTVAKYRIKMGIPSTRQRRKQKNNNQ